MKVALDNIKPEYFFIKSMEDFVFRDIFFCRVVLSLLGRVHFGTKSVINLYQTRIIPYLFYEVSSYSLQ